MSARKPRGRSRVRGAPLARIEDQIDLAAARKALANPKNKVRVSLQAVKKRLGV